MNLLKQPFLRSDLVPEGYEKNVNGRLIARSLIEEAKTVRYARRQLPSTRFIIFAQGRTGSTMLSTTLDQHSQITCFNEILRLPRLLPSTYVTNRAKAVDTPCVGFKAKIYQITFWQRFTNPADFLQKLHRRQWKIIWLWRDNSLRHVISNLFALNRKAYHMPTGGQNQKPNSLYVSLPKLTFGISQRQRYLEAERKALSNLPFFEINYERDLLTEENQATTFARIQDYLGVSGERLAPTLQRIVEKPLPDLVENWAEIETALRGTAQERYLH